MAPDFVTLNVNRYIKVDYHLACSKKNVIQGDAMTKSGNPLLHPAHNCYVMHTDRYNNPCSQRYDLYFFILDVSTASRFLAL